MTTAFRRVAALYDIHGNLPALDAALEAADAWGHDAVVVGGDVVLGPMPRECLARLLALGARVRFLRGNCDRMVLEAAEGRLDATRFPPPVQEAVRWVASTLTSTELRALAEWPTTLSLAVDGLGTVLFCHATPRSDDELLTERTPEDRVVAMLAGTTEKTVVCGHTHMSFDRLVRDAGGRATRVVNAGSVGMPFGERGAHWLRLGPDPGFERTSYDFESAAALVASTAYPGAADFAAKQILAPPAAETMLAAFTR